jgi:hypothetical protein
VKHGADATWLASGPRRLDDAIGLDNPMPLDRGNLLFGQGPGTRAEWVSHVAGQRYHDQ